jgi:MFS family permease
MALAPSLWMIGALYALGIGIAQLAMGPPGASKLAANWFSRGRGKALGISAMGASLGGFFAPPLLQLSIDAFGWRGALLASALAIAALALLPIALIVANRPEDKGLLPDGDPPLRAGTARPATAAPEEIWTVARLVRDRNFWVIGLGVGLAFAMITGVITAAALRHRPGHGPGVVLLSALALSAAAAKPVIGALGIASTTHPALGRSRPSAGPRRCCSRIRATRCSWPARACSASQRAASCRCGPR